MEKAVKYGVKTKFKLNKSNLKANCGIPPYLQGRLYP